MAASPEGRASMTLRVMIVEDSPLGRERTIRQGTIAVESTEVTAPTIRLGMIMAGITAVRVIVVQTIRPIMSKVGT